MLSNELATLNCKLENQKDKVYILSVNCTYITYYIFYIKIQLAVSEHFVHNDWNILRSRPTGEAMEYMLCCVACSTDASKLRNPCLSSTPLPLTSGLIPFQSLIRKAGI